MATTMPEHFDLDGPSVFRVQIDHANVQGGTYIDDVVAMNIHDAMTCVVAVYNDGYSRDEPIGLERITSVQILVSPQIIVTKTAWNWIQEMYGDDT